MKLRVKLSLLVVLLVVGALGVTGYLTYSFQHDLVIGQAERQARMLSRQILLTRRWVTDHDGLFVTKKPGTGRNHAPAESDVVDKSGQVYVKRDPGMIIWDLSDYAAQADFCRFRVTSLRPINPVNAPDGFERQGLLAFETGKEEVSEISSGKQGRILRYMIPLMVEESCLHCHAEHGYQVGNIRGGLSLEVPLGWADEAIAANNRRLLMVGLVSVVLAALITFLRVNTLVVRRLAGLAEGLERYPQPEPPERLPAGDDEIGVLGQKFVGMDERVTRSQVELALTREQLFQNEKQAAIGELAGAIAHEVDNSLAGMRDSLIVPRGDQDEREPRDPCLERFDSGLSRLANLVQRLKNIGRTVPLKAKETDIDGVIRNCFELLVFQLRPIHLHLDLTVARPCLLDGGLLKQVLVNIALNAIEAMPDGGELLVASREVGAQVVISVRNSGPGIPPGDLDHVFEPFSTTRTEGAGRDSRLSASYSLVRRLGGQLRVESRPGDGTLYLIELPRQSSGASQT